jgi:hypothetical protein
MPPTTIESDSLTNHPETLAFRRLVDEWFAGMGPSSNPQKLTSHPAFQQIIAMGDRAIPLVLCELQARPSLLVWALPTLAGENPVPSSERGKIGEMARIWVEWGRRRKYI